MARGTEGTEGTPASAEMDGGEQRRMRTSAMASSPAAERGVRAEKEED